MTMQHTRRRVTPARIGIAALLAVWITALAVALAVSTGSL